MTPMNENEREFDDDALDDAIRMARESYHVPPEPDLDAMWRRIEIRRGARSARPARRVAVRRWGWVAGIAAAIVVAFSLGRWSAPAPAGLAPQVDDARAIAEDASRIPAPVNTVATQLLGQTAELLTAIPVNGDDPNSDARFAQQASDLLVTTRLLLDARGAQNDPSLRVLLEDLELVLAQVARLRAGETRTERELITEALAQQDLVPRIRIIAAGLNVGAD